MSMSSGMPYVGSSTENLTLSDSRCMNDSCKAFYDAHQLSQKLHSYAHQYDYGHYVSWYLVAALAIFAIVRCLSAYTQYRHKKGSGAPSLRPAVLNNRLVALWRLFAYRRLPGWISTRFGLPSIGFLIFAFAFILYNCILTFAVRPYYRQHRGYGSPPLAVRTGLMATALTPWIVALSGKANLVTLLTGIGHEKLNILHRWISWLCFGLSVVHTVPFIVAPLKDGGYKALHKQYYKPGGFEFTGTPPMVILFGVLLLSLPWIRHRAYEAFYHMHFWLAVTYLGLLFWHCGNEGDSWGYLYATVIIWVMSLVARAVWFTRPANIIQSPWFVGSPITVTTFPDNMTLLQVLAPEDFHWKPGQHIYLRIPQLSAFDNHPFTVAGADTNTFGKKEQQTLPLFVRSHTGFTKRLRSHLDASPDTQLDAWVEGPYGGHPHDFANLYDTVVLVAGGGGISGVLACFEHFAVAVRSNQSLITKTVKLYWSVRQKAAMLWIINGLRKLDLASLYPALQVIVHVTHDEHVQDGRSGKKTEVSVVTQKPMDDDVKASAIAVRKGRIDFDSIFDDIPRKDRCLVLGCGPESLKVDLSNACARAQKKVLRSEIGEIALWTEVFGW